MRFHPEARLALLQGEGTLTSRGWEETARELVAGAGAGTIWRILSDRRRMASADQPGMEDRLHRIIRDYAGLLGPVQWAVVVPEMEVRATGLLTDRLSQGTPVRIAAFGDLGSAIQWLLGVYDDKTVAGLLEWIEESG